MEVITFSDNLVHYKARLKETGDYLHEVSLYINAATDCIESSWKGKGARACSAKLEELIPRLGELQTIISGIENTVAEIENITLSQMI